MRISVPALAVATMLPALSGCIASTVLDVATAPVRMAGKAVDLTTTSQSEADEKRGREIRRREERLGKLEREYRRHGRDCADGDREACAQARDDRDEMQAIMPGIPYERD
jgi:hypothetical protein